jgi:voltage-dependent potassium channel beta subunit
VISTKIFWGGSGPNDQGLSRKHIIEGTNAALKRLQLDYVDLIFCHRPDINTPIEETVRAMNHVIDQGKAYYWGTSEWSAQQITEACRVAQQLHLIAPIMEQPQYSMLHRTRFEVEYAPLYRDFGYGTTIWSPLASGLLSGKYSADPEKFPEGSRLALQDGSKWIREQLLSGQGMNGLEEKCFDTILKKVDGLRPIADKLGCTLAQLCLAWCVKNQNVSTVITGASRVSQVEENFKSLQVVPKLTGDVLEEIEKVLQNKPKPQTTCRRNM